MPNDRTYIVAFEIAFLVKLFKNFVDESSFHFFRVAQAKKISKNSYCYKNSEFEKRLVVPSDGSKMLLREKYKKNKKWKIKLLAPP